MVTLWLSLIGKRQKAGQLSHTGVGVDLGWWETRDDEDENSEGEGERRWETNDDEDEYSHGDGSDDGDEYGDGDDCPESLESTYAITTPVFCRAPM